MKPQKFLLTSLLAAAAMSAVPAFAADYTVANGAIKESSNKVASKVDSGATGATINGEVNTTGVAVNAGDNFTFDNVTGYLPGWNGGTFAGNIVLTGNGLTINNGNSGSYMGFSGSVSGAGDFIVNAGNDPAKGQDFIFTGNLTAFTGDFSRPVANFDASGTDSYNSSNTGILQFGGTASSNGIGSGTAYVASATAGADGIVHNISGQGSITTTSVLRYNYMGSANEGVTALGIDNSSISARYLDFCGGANYTVSSAVSGNNATAANNTLKISAGTTTFTGSIANFGTITVASGATAKLAEGAAFNLASVASAIAISGGGNFVLAGNVSLSADASGAPLSLTADTFSVEDTASFALTGAGRLGESVNFVSVSGGTVTAATLSTEKFTYNGHALSSRVTGVSLTESGSLAFTGKALSLTWKSDLTTGTWNKSDQNFTASDGTASSFVDYDDVTFATAGASVTIGEPIAAERITISEDTTFTASSSNTLSALNVAVESGKTLTISGSGGISNYSFGSVDVAENAVWDLGTYGSVAVSQTVTGSGTVKIVNSSGGHSVTVNLGEFSGILDFTGKFKSDGNTLGTDATIRISGSGANCNMWGGGTLANDVHFLTDYQIGDSTSTSITLSGRVSTEEGTTLTVGATRSGYTGTAIFSGGMDVSHLLVNDYGVVQIRNTAAGSGSSKTLNKVTLANGRTLTLYSVAQPTVATTIGELALSGAAATLAMTNFQGYWNVDKLSIGDQTSATLNLASSQSSFNTGIFEFGASSAGDVVGNFAGTFNVTSTDTGKTRSVSVVISNGDIAKKTVVNLASIGSAASSTTPSRLSLGVNASCVTIAGLVSTLGDNAGVYSGKVGTETDGASIPAGDSTTRTLVINTAESGDYSFNGKILANLNLEKTGAGTQTLAGASTAFNGSVKVFGGVLTLADASAIGSGNAVRIDGGQLKVGNGTTAVSLNAAAYTIVLSDAYSEDSGVAAIVGTSTANKSSVALATDTKITIELADSVAVSLAAEAAQYQYKIFDTATIVSDSFTIDSFALSEALKSDWRISDYTNGVLTIAAIPEPSVFGLLAGLGALALAGTRRRRKKA